MGPLKKKCYGGKMKASGGTVESGDPEMNYAEGGGVGDIKKRKYQEIGVHEPVMTGGGQSFTAAISDKAKTMDDRNPKKKGYEEYAKNSHSKVMSDLKSMPGPTSGKSGFAEGGYIGSYQSPCNEHCNHPGMPHEEASGYAPETHPMSEPTHQGLTDSGLQGVEAELDMIGRVMHKRKMMSQGGMAANQDSPIADFMPNEFDDLHLRDDLEFSDTGANSGDEDGPAEEDDGGEQKRRNDPVMRVMMKRRAAKRD